MGEAADFSELRSVRAEGAGPAAYPHGEDHSLRDTDLANIKAQS